MKILASIDNTIANLAKASLLALLNWNTIRAEIRSTNVVILDSLITLGTSNRTQNHACNSLPAGVDRQYVI